MTALATPTTAITDWITEKLQSYGGALDGLAIHVGVAMNEQPRPVPGAGPGPYITIRHLSTVYRYYATGGRIAGATSVFEITAWDRRNDVTRIKPIIAAVEEALHRQRGPAGDLYVSACVLGAAIERLHTDEEPTYIQLGDEYVIRTSEP